MYFFILGHNSTLSTAEIASVIHRQGGKFNLINLSEEDLLLEAEKKIDVARLQQQLGGTIKIGEILPIEIKDVFGEEIVEQIIKHLTKNRKIYFGFSIYKLDSRVDIKKIESSIRKLAMRIKTALKESGRPSRWVISKERILSSVVVQKNNLLTQGAEFCFFVGEGKIFLGRTLSCQEFEEYEFYDFNRPARSIEKGMLPPKLAKIMINLAQAPEDGTILDPLCGSGTILQEAVRLGHQNVIGSDISEEAVESARKNMEWLAKNPKPEILNPKQILNTKYQIFQCDVREISKKIPENLIDAIVTEPYLGPLKIGNWKLPLGPELGVEGEIGNLSSLYLSAFEEFKKILKSDGKIIIIFPVFQIGGEQHFLPILDNLKNDWQIINPIPEKLRRSPVIKLTGHGSIIYSRPDQHVLREIFIFIRNS